MTARFTAYVSILAARDAALLQLALLALALLVVWICARIAFSSRTQERLMLMGAIVYHLTLLAVLLGGSK